MEDKDALRELYFTIGLQYYVCARYAAYAGLIHVCGNLFHHTIEMYLKGYLCDSMDEAERRKLAHNLNDVWHKFKERITDPSWDRFDSLISDVDHHEKIRYPEKIVELGMIGYIHFAGRTAPTDKDGSPNKQPLYEVVVDELDALSKALFEKRMNSKAFISGLSSYAQDFLMRENKSPMGQAG